MITQVSCNTRGHPDLRADLQTHITGRQRDIRMTELSAFVSPDSSLPLRTRPFGEIIHATARGVRIEDPDVHIRPIESLQDDFPLEHADDRRDHEVQIPMVIRGEKPSHMVPDRR